METKRICSSSTHIQTQPKASCNWLPWDLWLQILSFLPVRTLLVFRSVCKSFLSIINDPEFVSLHLRRFPGNTLKSRFLTHKINYIYNDDEVIYEVRELNNSFASSPSTWNNKIIDRVMSPGIYTFSGASYLECSLNGLLLLRDYSSNTSVALWNPSIKKLRPLSLPSRRYLTFGLGHDPSSNDYKLVAFEYYDHGQAWVYSVRMDTWTKILDTRPRHKLGKDDRFYYSRSLSFKNKVLWIEHYEHYDNFRISRRDGKLLGFDFEIVEWFRYVEMPYSADERGDNIGLMMLDGGSSVGMWWVDKEERVFVWALETDAVSWTLRYKLGSKPSSLGYQTKFESRFWRYQTDIESRLEERNGELMWMYWFASRRELSVESYDIDVETQVYHNKFQGVVDCLHIYFESLVMFK